MQTQPYTFTVANPTNTLIVEWHEYAYNTATSQPCSMQVVMYDVTNEFEYHYDDDCYVDDIVGLVGVRETQNNVLQVRNDLTDRYSTGSAGTDPTTHMTTTLGLPLPIVVTIHMSISTGECLSCHLYHQTKQFL